MSTAFQLTVFETGIPDEILDEAAREVLHLHEACDAFDEIIQDKDFPNDPRLGSHINWRLRSRTDAEELYEFAPTLVEILDQFGTIRNQDGTLLHFPAGFTTNTMQPKQILAKHRDEGGQGTAYFSRIVNLRGIGGFIFVDDNDTESAPTEVTAGTCHQFANGPDLIDRPVHMVRNMGDGYRVSLAFAIPHRVLGIEYTP